MKAQNKIIIFALAGISLGIIANVSLLVWILYGLTEVCLYIMLLSMSSSMICGYLAVIEFSNVLVKNNFRFKLDRAFLIRICLIVAVWISFGIWFYFLRKI